MKKGFTNGLLNPGYDYWDYGLGPFTGNNIYTASRWKMTRGDAAVFSVEPGMNDGSMATPRWLRGRRNMSITVAPEFNPVVDSIQIRQRIEQGTRFGEQCVILSGIAAGPAGGKFCVGVDNQNFEVNTLGQVGGIDDLTHFAFAFTIGTQSQEFLPFDCFTRPSMAGVYKMCFSQVEFTEIGAEPSQFELRDPSVERMLLNRYVLPVGRGLQGVTTTTGMHIPVRFPTEMRINPQFRQLLSSAIDLTSLTAGTTATSSATVNASSTGVSQSGGRLSLLSGWTGLTNGGAYMLATDGIGVYDADY